MIDEKQTTEIVSNFGSRQNPQYVALVDKINRPLMAPQQAPPMVRLLSRYAQTLGYKPMGSISNAPGNLYVGVKQQVQGDTVIASKFPQNKIPKVKIPNIPLKAQYYANRAINSWNNYVQNQAQLSNFLGQISGGSQARQAYVQKQLLYLNLQQFNAQALATLSYYYLYIPLLKFNKIIGSVGSSKQNFIANYQVGDNKKDNPLLLNKSDALVIAKLLINADRNDFIKPLQLMASISSNLDTIKGKSLISANGINQISQYLLDRQNQANQYFIQAGIQKNASQTLMAGNQWKVKQMKFIIKPQFQNSVMQKAIISINQQRNTNAKQKKWDLIWGSPTIYSHDYVFN